MAGVVVFGDYTRLVWAKVCSQFIIQGTMKVEDDDEIL